MNRFNCWLFIHFLINTNILNGIDCINVIIIIIIAITNAKCEYIISNEFTVIFI